MTPRRNAQSPQVKAGIYTRISFDRTGQGLGVERQQAECEALAKRLGWTVVDTFTDNDISAMTGKVRPGFEALLDALKRDEINAVLCWQTDRLYRRVSDLARLLELPGVPIRTVNGGDFDLGHSTGRMLATILGSVSTQESELKSERQRASAAQYAQRGLPKWRTAFGYLPYLGDKRDDDGTRQRDPVTAPLVARVYSDVLQGGSITDAAKWLNTVEGGLAQKWNHPKDADGKRIPDAPMVMTRSPWTPSTLSLFLRSPRNAGLREYDGQIVGTASWPALVEESVWRATHSVLNAHTRTVNVKAKGEDGETIIGTRKVKQPGRKSVQKHLLTGVLKCGREDCNNPLAGNWVMQKDGTGHRITYSCKACRGVSVRAEHVEPEVRVFVCGVLSRPDATELLRAEVHDAAEAEALRARRTALAVRLEEIADERADGLIDGAGYRRMVDRIGERIAEIDSCELDSEKARLFDGLPLGTAAVGDAIDGLSADRYRAVISALAEIVVMPVGKGHRPRSGDRRFDPERVQFHRR